jgi:hypothetical protein
LGANEEKTLSGFDGVKGFYVNARSKDGSVINASEEMNNICAKQIEEGNYPIVHGVFGGKTGVRDEVMPDGTCASDYCEEAINCYDSK